MRLISYCLSLITFVSCLQIVPAFAQEAAPQSSPMAAPSGSIQMPSPEALAVAKELMIATNQGSGIRDLIPGVTRSFATIINRDNPGKAETINQILEQAFTPAFLSHSDDFENQLATIIAADLSISDMQGIIAFYKTSAGQNYLKVLPKLAEENDKLAHRWAVRVSKEVAPSLFDALRKNNLVIPKEMGG